MGSTLGRFDFEMGARYVHDVLAGQESREAGLCVAAILEDLKRHMPFESRYRIENAEYAFRLGHYEGGLETIRTNENAYLAVGIALDLFLPEVRSVIARKAFMRDLIYINDQLRARVALCGITPSESECDFIWAHEMKDPSSTSRHAMLNLVEIGWLPGPDTRIRAAVTFHEQANDPDVSLSFRARWLRAAMIFSAPAPARPAMSRGL